MSEQVIPEPACCCPCHDDGEPWCDMCFDSLHKVEDGEPATPRYQEEISQLEAKVAEQEATIAEQKTDLILSAAVLLRKLKLEPQLHEIRTKCFDDSHWAKMIDAALTPQGPRP